MAEPLARRVEALYFAACEREPAQRAAFLAARAEDDPEAADEVRAMLDLSDEQLGRVFAEPAYDAASGESAGDQLGPYKLLERLGEGGFGTVWRAEQMRPVRRTVALKILKAGMDTKQVLARFEAERNALSLMNHPSIARVVDAGATERGRPFFVMELVEGIPITEFCDREELSIERRLALFLDVCAAVQHAHQKGVIHRDLKPANILVTMLDGQPVPKVIDFGIAKATGQSLTDGTLYTLQGQLLGTPEYMSPEQAEMSGIGVDSTTDVYALGVLLYELLTGVLPFAPETLRSRGLSEIHRILREEEPPKPSTRVSTLGADTAAIGRRRRIDPRRLRTELSGDLDWIVLRAMEKQRTRRYPSASELAADVRRHLDDEPVLAGPPSAAYRARKFVRRNRASVVFAGTVLFLLVGGIAATTRGMFLADRAREAAEEAREDAVEAGKVADAERAEAETQAARAEASLAAASTEAARARAVTDFLLDTLGLADPDVADLSDMSMTQVLDEAAARVEETFHDYPENEAEVRLVLGRAYFTLGRPDLASPHLRRALELHRAVLNSDARPIREVLSVLWWSAYRNWEDDWLALAVENRQLALELLRREHPALADGLAETVEMAMRLTVSEAQLRAKWEPLVDEGLERIAPDEPVFRDFTWAALGAPLRLGFRRATTDASQMIESVLSRCAKGMSRQFERSMTEVSLNYRVQVGDAAGIRALLDGRAGRLAARLDPNHWYQEIYRYYEAHCLVQEGRGEEAREILEHCLAALDASPAPNLPEGWGVRMLLAKVHEQAGRAELAQARRNEMVERMLGLIVPHSWPATKTLLPPRCHELLQAVDAFDTALARCGQDDPTLGACTAQLASLANGVLEARRRLAPDDDPVALVLTPFLAVRGQALLASSSLADRGEALMLEAHRLGKRMRGSWIHARLANAAKLHGYLVLAGRDAEASELASDLADLVAEAMTDDRGWNWASPETRNAMLWDVVRVPGLSPEATEAVAGLARELLGNEQSSSACMRTLGVALYRAGHYEEARAQLRLSTSLSEASGSELPAADMAFLAMSTFRLGRSTEAARHLATLRAWASAAGRDLDRESAAFLAEADRVVASDRAR